MKAQHATPRVSCDLTVLKFIQDAARQAAPKETGGILIGWREGQSVVIFHALTVVDAEARHTEYQRSHAAAEAALSAHLDAMADERLGYVGEWHSHPLPKEPSGKDWASLRGVATKAGGTVALLVGALNPDTQAVHTFGGIGYRNRLGRARIRAVDVDVLELPNHVTVTLKGAHDE